MVVAVAPASIAAPSEVAGRASRAAWFGPAFVASVAYMDPGNFASNVAGGADFSYRLLWILLWGNGVAIIIQYLWAKLGILTGHTLSESCRRHFRRPVTVLFWLAAEAAAVALLASGLASSVVGTMAGQVVLTGFLKVRLSAFLRRLITLIPAVAVILAGVDTVRALLLSQVVLSLVLPFALVRSSS